MTIPGWMFGLVLALATLWPTEAYRHPFQRRQVHSNGVDDVPPPGMTSLTFVFDRTGSMNDDLVQVRHGAKGIFETVMKQRKKLIYNYVLVLFHDPDVDPPFISTDPDLFQQELASVTVQGGGDCPEMTMSGIKKALEVSLPGSYIYVFTDARAKDYHLEERVLNLIQERQSSVVFVMTGDCGNQTSPGYRVFERVAAASFGQVFHLEKSHVKTVLEYVKQTVQQRKIHLLYEVREHGTTRNSSLAVDGAMTELTISLSGQRDDSDFLDIALIDPEGDPVDRSRYEHREGTIDLRNVKLIRVSNPEPGMWHVRTTARSMHTLRVFGHSGIDFKFGFASRIPPAVELAHPRPIANQHTYLLVNMTGLAPPGELLQVSLVDYHGRILYKNDTRKHPDNDFLYYVGPFMPPKGFFFVRIQGEDATSYEFVRISPTAVSTVDASGPRAYMAERTTATAYQPANLSCSVESVVPYTVFWRHGNRPLAGPLFYERTDTALWTIDVVSPHNRGYYTCEVVSANGNFTARTYLDTREPPPHIIAPRNESTLTGGTAFLHCQTQSLEQAQIDWLRKGYVVGNSDKVYQYPNGTLRILDSTHNDAGPYTCRATTSGGTTEARVHLSVNQLPTAVVQPRQLFVVPGKDFTLQCTVRGEPLPAVTWMHDGLTVKNDANHYVTYNNELVVRDVGPGHVGLYECRAQNAAGVAADYAEVKFAQKPVIHVTQNRELVSRGQPIQLDCRIVVGHPAPGIRWFKDDRPVWPSANVVMEGTRLTVKHAMDTDAGAYTCKAENMAGTETKTLTVTIGNPPSMVPTPEQLEAKIENSITIPCRTVGTPKPKVQWTKDGRSIDVSDPRFIILPDDSLMIQNVQVEDKGYYTCTAQNEFGQRQKSTLVAVTGLVSPILAQAPPESHLIEGQDLRLACVVLMGNPKPRVTWLRDGRPVEESAAEMLEPDGALILRGGTADQQGRYTCVAQSAAGNATLTVDVVLIMRPNVVDPAAPLELKAKSGEPMDIKCPIAATPGTKVVWEEDGEPISAVNPGYAILPDNVLRIHKADREHAGRYTCRATNEAGQTAYTVSLLIQTAPAIASGPSSFSLLQGDSVALTCDAESDPPAEVQWYLNDVLIEDPTLDEYGTLVLESVGEGERGAYKCVARNQLGQDEKTVVVTVHTAPQIDKAQLAKAKTATVHKPVVLECPARAFPAPERQWLFEGSRLDPKTMNTSVMKVSQDGSLVLLQAQLAHAGTYECQVSNLAGNDSVTYSLQVQEPARLLAAPAARTTAIAGVPLQLACRAGGAPQPALAWEKDGVRLPDHSDRHTITRTGVLRLRSPGAADAGLYTCVARNVAGSQSASTTVDVKSPPSFKPAQKPKYQLLEGQPGYIHCLVDAVPQPKINWYRDNKPLVDGENGISILANGTLHLSAVSRLNAGLFTCEAANEAGRADALIAVEVVEKPRIRTAGAPAAEQAAVVRDAPLVLHCPVVQAPMLAVRWLKDGQPVQPALDPNLAVSGDGRRLSLAKAQLPDAGQFECVATNPAGEVRKLFSVDVMIAPTVDFSAQKQKVTAIEGSRVVIACPVSGHPKPNVTWLAALETGDASADNLQRGAQDTLVIESVQLANAGPYVCVASNRAGSVDVSVDLVVFAPPRIVPPADPPRVEVDKPFTLNCEVEIDDGQTSVKWMFNGRDSLPSNAQIPLHGRRLIIHRANEENSGVYTCVVYNQVGKAAQDFSVDVAVPPQLVDPTPHTDTITLVEGKRHTLRCDVKGNPPPKVQWFRDDQLMPEAEGHATIEVEPVEESLGKSHYACVVANNVGMVTRDFFVQSIFAPKIAPLPLERRQNDVYEGNAATFECPVANLRPDDLEVEWLQRGKPVRIDSKRHALSPDHTKLTIFGIDQEDEGEYTCVVKNAAGKAATDFELHVLKRPEILNDLFVDVQFVEEAELHLECLYNGLPAPRVTWRKDGGPLPPDAKVIADGRSVHAEHARPAHAGLYECRVSNKAGTAVKTHNVTVLQRPRLLHQDGQRLRHQPVAQAQSALLDCGIQSDAANTTFVWLKDGAALAEAEGVRLLEDGRKLQLTHTAPQHQGTYTCIVKNRAGEEKQDFEVEVQTAPQILTASRRFEVAENNSVAMVCEAVGEPRPTVRWFRNDYQLEAGGQVQIASDGETLRIAGLRPADHGFYICRAENALGRAETGFQVDVIQRPALLQVDTDREQVKHGDSIALACPIKDPGFLGNITWMFNLKPIDPSLPKYTVLQQGRKLIIQDAALPDSGTYSCVVQNAAGENRADHTLDVLVAPSIQMLDRDRRRTVLENGTLVLECQANGNPEPRIRWFKDGQPLDARNAAALVPGARFVGTALRLENIRREPGAGRYTCEAENAAGAAAQDVIVEVQTLPRIQRLKQPGDVDGQEGDRVELQCPVEGTPTPQVSWLKDGQPLEPEPNALYTSQARQRLNFAALRRSDAARYTCVARNAAGADQRDFQLRVLAEPRIDAANLAAERAFTVNGTISLSCPAAGIPEPRVSWMREGEALRAADARVTLLEGGRELRLDAARLADAGTYTCLATNAAGFADYDTLVRVFDRPKIAPGAERKNVATPLNKPAVLECDVSNMDESMRIEWRKAGRTVGGAKGVVEASDTGLIQITDHGKRLHILAPQPADAVQWTCVATNRAGTVHQHFQLEVLVAPTIEERASSPHLLTGLLGRPVQLHCRASANPQPQILWRRNGEPITDPAANGYELRDHNRTLHIATPTPAHEGRFSCDVQNNVGQASRTFALLLSAPPALGAPHEEVRTVRGKPVVLDCEPADGSGPFTALWFKDKEQLESKDNVVIDNTHLMINNAQPDQSGDYSCVVSNKAGQSRKEFGVHIMQRPKFKDSSENNPVLVVGRSLLIDCNVDGIPTPTVTWKKDGQPLLAGPNERRQLGHAAQHLYVDRAQAADAGVYTCVAENGAGAATRTVFVSAAEQPRAAAPFQLVEVRENATRTLACLDAAADPARYTFAWTRDGAPLPPAPNLKFSDQGSRLHFTHVLARDAGKYVCAVENDDGRDEAVFALSVLSQPRIQQPGPAMSSVAVKLHEQLSLKCSAHGSPKPEIAWLFNGSPVAKQVGEANIMLDVINVELEDGNLTVYNITRANDGRYTCVASNKAGRTEADVLVEVLIPPVLSLPAEPVQVVQGKELVLRGTLAEGSLPVEVVWRKGDLEMATVTEAKPDGQVYLVRVPKVGPTDAGIYTIVVQNRAGLAKQDVVVEVLIPPSIEAGERVLSVVEGFELVLACEAGGRPPPLLQWFHEGARLPNATHARHTLRNASVALEGRYTCEATNRAGTAAADFAVDVLRAPRIRDHRPVVKAVEGERARLECKFTGNPEPTIKWTRSGHAIQPHAQRVLFSPRGEALLMPKVGRADAGDYACVATNRAGRAEATFSVVVQSAPRIDEPIDQGPRVVAGRALVLECPALGEPAPAVVWWFGPPADEVEVDVGADGPYAMQGNHLLIRNVSLEDAGRYTCRAQNEIGQLDTHFELEVIVAPTFGESVQRVYTVVEGNAVSMVCPAEASQTPEIRWLRNGDVIPLPSSKFHASSNLKKLRLTNATLADAGKYVCRATNDAGHTDIDLSLKVVVPPRIDESNVIGNPLAVLGRSIYLECPASAIPQPSISWLKDGRPVDLEETTSDGRTPRFSLQQGNQTFGIREVEHADRGTYTCMVVNAGGSASEDFEVDVLVPPVMEKEVTSTPLLITKRENESVTIVCPVRTSVDKNEVSDLTISWTQDGRTVDLTSSNIEVSPNGKRLTIKSVRLADGGHYKCVASNRAGQSHAKFHVDVLSVPTIVEEKINASPTVQIGRSTVLWCPASGHPPPTVRWFKGNGEEVKDQAGKVRLLDRGQGLELVHATLEDIGTWTCRAENDAGITEKAIELNVWVEPEVQVRSVDSPVQPIGASVTLLCNATGNPKPGLTWNRDGQLLIPRPEVAQISVSGGRLDIVNLNAQSTGRYTCVARNELGFAEDSVFVDILVTPEINRENLDVNRRLITGRSLTLYCEAEGKPAPDIRWFLNGSLITEQNATNIVFGTDNKFIQITNATLSDKGVYECEAQNEAGNDRLQYVITVDLIPSIVNSGTSQVVEGNVAVMECEATGEPRPKVTWQRNGIRVETGVRYVVDNTALKIIDTHSSDSGIYVCVATNEAGTDQQAFTLEVLVAPRIVHTSANETIVAVGGELALRCGSSAYPSANTSWLFMDEPVEDALADANYSLAEDGTLTVRGLRERGRLHFKCVVWNEAGEDSVAYVVQAIAAPTTIGPDQVRQVNSSQGQPTLIVCEIEVGAESQVVWKRNGELIKFGADVSATVVSGKSQLQFADTELANEGEYECVVANMAGNATQKTQLFVGVGPRIGAEPRRVIVRKGERARLWCETGGIPPPRIRWLREGAPVPAAHLAADPDDALRLAVRYEAVQPAHAGIYTCRAENWAGAAHKDVDLVVLTPPVIEPHRFDVNASLGDTIILPCNASGNPEPVISWMKVPNMTLIGKQDKYQTLGTSLAIQNVGPDDDDFYQCVARSDAGTATAMRRVTVHQAAGATAASGGPSRVWVECDADQRPTQNAYVPPRGDVPTHADPAHIAYLPWEQRHQHAAAAANGAVVFFKCFPTSRDPRDAPPAAAAATDRAPGEAAPRLLVAPPRALALRADEPLRLHCSATGAPPPILIWSRDGAVLDEADGVRADGGELSVPAGRVRAGLYACLARNEVSLVEAAAESVVPLTMLECARDALEVSWWLDGERIEPGARDDRLHVLANGSLVLRDHAGDAAELARFGCAVFAAAGGPERRVAPRPPVHFGVAERAPRVRVPQAAAGRVRAATGRPLRLDCLLVAGPPALTRVRWTKDNVNLDIDGRKLVVAANNSLIINDVTSSDRGSYKCRAWNRKGKSYDEVGVITGDLPAVIEARIHGRLNGRALTPTKVRFARPEANLNSNDLLVDLAQLSGPLGVNAVQGRLVGLMATPGLQLGFDPDRGAHETDPLMAPFERHTHYRFGSGERMRVRQRSVGPVRSDGMQLDVELDGDLPGVKSDNVAFEPLEEDLIASNETNLIGQGGSALKFGKGRLPFSVHEDITLKLAKDREALRAGTTLHLKTNVESESDEGRAQGEQLIRIKINANRFGECPDGYVRIKEYCKDIDECALDETVCADHSKCLNRNGGFECERDCAAGFAANADGQCADLDECAWGMAACANGTECSNTQGDYECVEACPAGYERDGVGNCVDVDECASGDACAPGVRCANAAGGHACAAAEAARPRARHLSFEAAHECAEGAEWDGAACARVDECAFDAPCQFRCEDAARGFRCACPEGYVLDEFGQCLDVDECQVEGACGEGELCFNQLGDYSCIAHACPPHYRLRVESADTATCLPTCTNCTVPVVHIYLLPLPLGLPKGTPLARLAAHDTRGKVLRNTTFHEVRDVHEPAPSTPAVEVRVREGRATLLLNDRLPGGTKQRLNLRSSSLSADGAHRYASHFHIFTAISKYPF